MILNEALKDLEIHGFDSVERVNYWMMRLRAAAEATMTPTHQMERMLREALAGVYRRQVDQGGVLKMHPGVSRYTLDKVRPELRNELDRRIMASASLIKLDREREIEATLQRFYGYATSIPKGGTDQMDRGGESKKIRKSLSGLSFRERRVLIDQGHKLQSAISETVAVGGGAIAGVWRSRWREINYDYREDHKERDGELYVVRGNWAAERGLMKPAGRPYVDEITKPGEEVFCRCNYTWIYNLRSLPSDMITKKGQEALAEAKEKMAQLGAGA